MSCRPFYVYVFALTSWRQLRSLVLQRLVVLIDKLRAMYITLFKSLELTLGGSCDLQQYSGARNSRKFRSKMQKCMRKVFTIWGRQIDMNILRRILASHSTIISQSVRNRRWRVHVPQFSMQLMIWHSVMLCRWRYISKVEYLFCKKRYSSIVNPLKILRVWIRKTKRASLSMHLC